MDPDWAAPPLWQSELRNILALYLRKNLLTREQALDSWSEAEAAVTGLELSVDTAAVLDIAASSGCSGYDSEFIALAMNFNIRLVTTDREVLQKFPAVAMHLDDATP